MTVIKSGADGNVANVNSDKQVEVCSVSETSLEFASKKKEKAYSWFSTYAATAADEVVSIKNTSITDILIIDEIIINSSAAANFTLFKVNNGTAAGTTVAGVNLNLKSGNTASATAFGNAAVTGSLSGDTIARGAISAASDSKVIDLKGGLVLGQNNEIAVTTSATATIDITIIGHFKAI